MAKCERGGCSREASVGSRFCDERHRCVEDIEIVLKKRCPEQSVKGSKSCGGHGPSGPKGGPAADSSAGKTAAKVGGAIAGAIGAVAGVAEIIEFVQHQLQMTVSDGRDPRTSLEPALRQLRDRLDDLERAVAEYEPPPEGSGRMEMNG